MSLLPPSLRSFAAWAVALMGATAAYGQAPIAKVTRVPAGAQLLPLSDQWTIAGQVPVYAALLSLQGLANREAPRLYLEYPANWQWEIVRPLIGFLEKRHSVEFGRLPEDGLDAALARYSKAAKGVVVWDPAVRASINVAFTAAGVDDLVVVTADLLPLAAKHGLPVQLDLRGKFIGQADHQIYQWAFDRYFERCNRDYYAVLGGETGMQFKGAIADFAVRMRMFCADLSANPKHPEELALLNRVLGSLNPAGMVVGWHSYAKDTEGQHTTLTSRYGLKMEGLHNLPNLSFTSQVDFTPGFRFTNRHNVRPDERLVAEKKVYVAALSTDAMGIGSWTKPGRGEIPYGWQVLMGWLHFNRPALQFFYESRTDQDYFIGGLSGPGYMYPKAIPADKFTRLMADARQLMQTLDLRVLEIMDYSEGNRHVGNTDLPKELVDRYYREFPDVLGFINGYGTARTFDLRGGVPLISYDYYLDVNRPVEEAAADLEELMALNLARPYFLLMHVRERNTVEKVKAIFDRLSEPAEIVPVDRFLKLAASSQTYRTRYQLPEDPVDHNP